jgi:predicted DNA binding CopG/RHH family protein
MTTQNKHYTKKKESRIPKFANREEEAAFWDTHDISDYWDELKPVKLKVAKNLSKGITIRFDEETLRELREQANRRGIGPTTLVRMWILERLRGSSSHNSTRSE